MHGPPTRWTVVFTAGYLLLTASSCVGNGGSGTTRPGVIQAAGADGGAPAITTLDQGRFSDPGLATAWVRTMAPDPSRSRR